MNAQEIEEQILALIPVDVLHQQKLQYFFLELLRKIDTSTLFDPPLELPDWPSSNLNNKQLVDILQNCKEQKKFGDWPVPAYLASLASTHGCMYQDTAYQWASVNLCMILKLHVIGGHEETINELCTRFRLAHQIRGGYEWLWDYLPILSIDLAHISTQFQSTLSEIEQNPDLSRLSRVDPEKCVAEILSAYDYAMSGKAKIHREGSTRIHQETSIQSQPYRSYGDLSRVNELISPVCDKTSGSDYRELRDDYKSGIYLDRLDNPQKGTEHSASMQRTSTRMLSKHITRRDFEFPTDPYILALPDSQRLFNKLWLGVQDSNVIDACLLLSMLTGTQVEVWFDIQKLIDDSNLVKIEVQDKESKNELEKVNFSWRIELDIADLKRKEIREFTVNLQKEFALPLPNSAIHLLLNNQSPPNEALIKRVKAHGVALKIPLLTVMRIPTILHATLKRHLADHHIADLICGVSPSHSTGLYYSSFELYTILSTYTSAIELLKTKAPTFSLEYLQQEFEAVNFGSQLMLKPALVSAFFDSLYDHVSLQTDHMEQFNAYTILMWHYFLLLTSARPVNHAPGMLDQIDMQANLLWVSDKEIRQSSSAGRFIPLCNYLCTALEDYLNYLEQFYAKYHVLGHTYDAINDVFTSQTALLNLFVYDSLKPKQVGLDPEIILSPITPELVNIQLKKAFPLALNWPRHFGRYYLATQDISTSVINAVFGHESPDQEALHPYSSLSISQIKKAGDAYEKMTKDLNLKRIQFDVI